MRMLNEIDDIWTRNNYVLSSLENIENSNDDYEVRMIVEFLENTQNKIRDFSHKIEDINYSVKSIDFCCKEIREKYPDVESNMDIHKLVMECEKLINKCYYFKLKDECEK